MDALGRLVNVMGVGDAKWVAVKDCGGVLFSCYLTGGAGDTYTLAEATAAAGTGAQSLAVITRYWTCTGDGTDAWVARTQAAAATVVTAAAATQNHMVFEVDVEQLSAGFTHLRCTSTGAGLVTPIMRDLKIQRRPSNLPIITV